VPVDGGGFHFAIRFGAAVEGQRLAGAQIGRIDRKALARHDIARRIASVVVAQP
jgi:hypothetical protein